MKVDETIQYCLC